MNSKPRTARRLWLLPLLMYFLLTAWSARANSLTIDEGLHIASGYTILRTGDYRLVEEHPPLVKLWVALPLLPLRSLPDPTTLPAWEAVASQADATESLPLLQMAQQLLYPHTPTARWLLPARLMQALLGVLLLATLARWGCDLWGWRGGALAVALAALDPNLIAHGAIAGTDLGATTFIVLSLFVAQRFLHRPTRAHTLLTGVTLGLTLATKLTALLLGPALGLAALWHLWRAPTREARARLFRRGLLVLALTGATFWAVYGFQIGKVPGVPGVPFPVPAAAHAIPILRLLGHSSGGHQAYLLGQNSTHGWWYYFPVAFLLKTPLPALILALLALLRRLAQRRPLGPGLAPALFALVYIATSLLSSLNIGYRHLLPL
ncbi:MAG: phospholipid carrier-dependent glycosyltransferase, partial [Anaerolineales bacterium]